MSAKYILNPFDKKIILRGLQKYNVIDMLLYIGRDNIIYYVVFFEREGIIFSQDFYFCDLEFVRFKPTACKFLTNIEKSLEACICDLEYVVLKKGSVKIFDVDSHLSSFFKILDLMIADLINCEIDNINPNSPFGVSKFNSVKENAKRMLIDGRWPFVVFNYCLKELNINNLELVNKIRQKTHVLEV